MSKREKYKEYLDFVIEDLKQKIEFDYMDKIIYEPFFQITKFRHDTPVDDKEFFNYVNTHYGIADLDFEYIYNEIIDFVREEVRLEAAKWVDDMSDRYFDEDLFESREIIKESGFSRVNRILQGDIDNISTYGIITAQNPCGCELTKKENRILQKELENVIGLTKLGFHKIGGNFFYNEEESLLIPNIRREDIIKLGVAFKQYSIIYGYKDVKPNGEIYMHHYMLRTYCDGFCRSQKNWGGMTLREKLSTLKPLDKEMVGSVESESVVALTGGDISDLQTNYSYVGGKDRRFKIPFYESEVRDIIKKELIKIR